MPHPTPPHPTTPPVLQICSLLEVDGIRGDMVVNRAAKALVALEDRPEVTLDDVARVIALCLNHRCPRPRLHGPQPICLPVPRTCLSTPASTKLGHCDTLSLSTCSTIYVASCRMRKDPLDPIDNGTKVALAFRRVTNPKVRQGLIACNTACACTLPGCSKMNSSSRIARWWCTALMWCLWLHPTGSKGRGGGQEAGGAGGSSGGKGRA